MHHTGPHHQPSQTDAGPGHTGHATTTPKLTTLTIPTGSLCACGCRETVDQRLRQHPHVASVHLDTEHQVAHVQVHDGMVTVAELAELVANACERTPTSPGSTWTPSTR